MTHSIVTIDYCDIFVNTDYIGEEWVHSGEGQSVSSLNFYIDLPEGTYDATIEYNTVFHPYGRSDNEHVGWIDGNRFMCSSSAGDGSSGTWTGEVTGGTVNVEMYAKAEPSDN